MDLTYAVDASSSVRLNNWNDAFIPFLKDTVSNMPECRVAPRGLNVALVTFSNNAALEFNLHKHQDLTSLHAAIDQITWTMGSTYVGKGLLEVDNKIYYNNPTFDGSDDRSDADHGDAVVILTDGQPTDLADAKTRAAALRAEGVEVYVVAVLLNTVSKTRFLQVSNVCLYITALYYFNFIVFSVGVNPDFPKCFG